MLLALIVRPLIHGVICPNLFAMSMLQIIFPLALISGSILMDIYPVAIGLIIKPFAFENIAIDMPKFSMATSFIQTPVAFILGPILPYLNPIPMLHIPQPLSLIRCSVFEVNFSTLF
jgi:hypothetical protein